MARAGKRIVSALSNVLIALSVAEVVRLVVAFFGQLASQGWGKAIIAATDFITVPAGIGGIKTPYGGVFDIDAVISIGIFLIAEWLVSVIRPR